MENSINKIQTTLSDKYNLTISEKEIKEYIDIIFKAQEHFPITEQRALIMKLLNDWKARREQKIFTITSEACSVEKGPCVITFGVLSVDWPGLSDTCLGIIHEMGWNIYFLKGFSLKVDSEDIGIILIGVISESEESYNKLTEQSKTILTKIKQAAIGTKAKTYLITEEIRKLEIYSEVIGYIENVYHEDDLENIIGLNGEAVKYFAARSRDYIENRKIEDIAQQIIRNFTFIKKVKKTGKTIQLDISNFTTKTEGTFTGVTVAGPAHMLHLEDCLKTIELTNPDFQLKHNREFTTGDGISLYRIEFINATGHALSELEQSRLKKAFSTMVLNKRQDRAQWIESIGGFEQYARAIIPLLVKETQNTGKPQVYHAVGNATDLFIDFKVIIVVPESGKNRKKLVTNTINDLESVDPFHILAVKPPKKFGSTDVFIIDLRVNLTDIENTETIYKVIKEKIHSALGDYRDFDEGMRNIDTLKLKTVCNQLEGINKNLIRELYYSIEDFFRVSASSDEIIAHIRIALDMLQTMDTNDSPMIILCHKTGTHSQKGIFIPTATLLCISYPHRLYFLKKILEILESYDVTLSRLEKRGRDILICRVTDNEKDLSDNKLKELKTKLKKIPNKQKIKNNGTQEA